MKSIGMLLALAAAALVLPGLLTGMLRPVPNWLFPLPYAVCTLLVGATIALDEPRKALVWLAFGAATFVLGLFGSKFVLRR